MTEPEDIERVQGRMVGREEAYRRAQQARRERLVERIQDIALIGGALGVIWVIGWVNGWWWG